MPAKLKREIQHIIDSEIARGLSPKEAAHRAYGHVMNNPMDRQLMLKDRPKKKKRALSTSQVSKY